MCESEDTNGTYSVIYQMKFKLFEVNNLFLVTFMVKIVTSDNRRYYNTYMT